MSGRREKKSSHPSAHPLYYPIPAAVQQAGSGSALSVSFSQLSGQASDAQIPESAVTQHQAALDIAASQVVSGELAPARIAGGTPITGYIPVYQADGSVDWVAAAGGSPHALSDHTDVDFTGLADGDVMMWDATAGKWVPLTLSGGAPHNLDSHTDVNAPSPSNDHVLKWDSTPGEWVAGPIPAHTHPQSDVTNLVTDLAAKQAALAQGNVVVTTASLANNAEETGTVALGKNALVLKVVADRACWVRLYGTSAERTADNARLITQDPSVPVLADLIFEAGALTINCAPLIGVANRDGPVTTAIYYAIKNTSGATSTVQVTFTRMALET